ncbi:MAG: hypothetical protein QOF73_3109 [Thermomicrobiales bacterium]|nr:hypothetical protein [Thermomicrobiales bacterium]
MTVDASTGEADKADDEMRPRSARARVGTDEAKARRRENARKYGGLAILLVVALIVGGWELGLGPDPDPTPAPGPPKPEHITVNGIVGGKVAFMQDPDVVRLLKDRFGLTVTFTRVGSIEMIQKCQTGLDYCWPSSQNAGQTIIQKLGSSTVKNEIIFNSPIVVYTWAPVVDALIAQGIVEQTGDTYYLVDFPKLAQMIIDGEQWANIGLPQLYGKVFILTSDPTQSNTGNSFSGLLANTLNNGHVVDDTSVQTVLPQLKPFFTGLLPPTTTQLFEQCLSLGIGACPAFVAYESNLIELLHDPSMSAQHQKIRQEVRTLYPKPTVWSSQPLIALTPGGERLMAALRDPEIQRIGWEHHGFRPAVTSVYADPSVHNLPGIPASIDSIIQMPGPSVMDTIIQSLGPSPTPTAVSSSNAEPTTSAMTAMLPAAISLRLRKRSSRITGARSRVRPSTAARPDKDRR